jgi:hypothetical protein
MKWEKTFQKREMVMLGGGIMVDNYMQVYVRNSFKDNHFTVLGFTAANGHSTMCAIIIAASKLKVTDVTGFNPLSDDAQDVCGEEMKVLQEEIYAMKDEHSNGASNVTIHSRIHLQ